MAIVRYRYRQTSPSVEQVKLRKETDSSATIQSAGDGLIQDVDIDSAFVTDLDEAMALRGYVRIGTAVTGDPNDDSAFVRRTGDTMTGNINLNNNRITNVPTSPTALTDAANAQYVQDSINARDPKDACQLSTAGVDLIAAGWTPAGSGVGKTLTSPTNATTNNNFDSVAAVLNDRILVMDNAGANAVHNGYYKLTQAATGAVPAILTRATDFDQDAEVTNGAYTFITKGTLYQKFGFQLTTADPIVVDTTLLSFTPVMASDAVIAGAGLVRTVNTIDVELDTAAAAQTAGSGGGSSGLEFDTAGAAGKLRAKVDPSGGIQRLAAGLALELDPAGAVETGAPGVKVRVDGTSIVITGNQLTAPGAAAPMLEWGANSISATTTSRFLFPTYEDSLAPTATIQIRVTRAGTLRKLRVHHNDPHGNGNDIVYTVRVNGTNSSIAATLASTASDGSDLVNTAVVAAGDLVDIIVTKAASIGTTPNGITATLEYAA